MRKNKMTPILHHSQKSTKYELELQHMTLNCKIPKRKHREKLQNIGLTSDFMNVP